MVLSERVEEEADDLQSVNSVDALEELQNEQTWPTEEEMADAPALNGSVGERIPDAVEGTTPRLKRVPKGTSQYQAAWIIESDESDVDEEEGMEQDGASYI
jgi:pre-rRNA-processing protein TSR1